MKQNDQEQPTLAEAVEQPDETSKKLVKPDDTTPVLSAYRISDGDPSEWTLFCPSCLRWHFHGGQIGHRTAHCLPGGYSDYIGVDSGFVTLAKVLADNRKADRRDAAKDRPRR